MISQTAEKSSFFHHLTELLWKLSFVWAVFIIYTSLFTSFHLIAKRCFLCIAICSPLCSFLLELSFGICCLFGIIVPTALVLFSDRRSKRMGLENHLTISLVCISSQSLSTTFNAELCCASRECEPTYTSRLLT